MSIIPPFIGYPPQIALPNTTPYTMRDGDTNAQILRTITNYIQNDFIPAVQRIIDERDSKTTTQIEKLIDDVNESLLNQAEAVNSALSVQASTVNTQLANQNAAVAQQLLNQSTTVTQQLSAQNQSVAQRLADNLAAVNAAVAEVIETGITVSDPVIVGVLENRNTDSRALIDALLTDRDFVVKSRRGAGRIRVNVISTLRQYRATETKHVRTTIENDTNNPLDVALGAMNANTQPSTGDYVKIPVGSSWTTTLPNPLWLKCDVGPVQPIIYTEVYS